MAVDSGEDSGCRLFRQTQLELVQQERVLPLRLSMSGQDQVASVGGRQLHVEHLQGGELLQDGSWGELRRAGLSQVLQRHVKAIGDEGDGSCKRSRVLSRSSSFKPPAQITRQTGLRTAPWQHAIPWVDSCTLP